MKEFIFLVSIVALGWGIWIFQADRGRVYQQKYHEGCVDMYSSDPNFNVHRPIDELMCEGQGWQGKERLERNALVAIVVGGISALASGALVKEDWASKKRYE